MHELSIAINIVEIVEEELKKSGSSLVEILELEIGKQSGVVVEALQMAMSETIKSTPLEKAEFIYNETEPLFKCNQCLSEFIPEDAFTPCPECMSFDHEIMRGNELKIIKIIVR